MDGKNQGVGEHRFSLRPHRTLLTLSVPVLFSLIAEPVTGLVDTGFIAVLGSVELAALGVGTTVLSSFFWIFNFLAIGTQTEVAKAAGRNDQEGAARVSTTAIGLSFLFGFTVAILGFLLTPQIAQLLGAQAGIHSAAVEYMQIRWLGAPAILITVASFGMLRGLEDMKTPLWVAVFVNGLNIGLDAVLIFGLGPIQAMGIGGAALASVISQWLGAFWVLRVGMKRLSLELKFDWNGVRPLMRIGWDLFIRTGFLTLFLLLTTRSATRIGAEAGAAHQAIRQVWLFSALFLDSFAVSGQSLVAYFVGADRVAEARRVAWVVCLWSLGTGIALGVVMLALEPMVIEWLVPAAAAAVFVPAWFVAAVSQPLNAFSFATDGVHWGTGDFAYLRNVVLIASSVGAIGLWLVDESQSDALVWVWRVTVLWILIRAAFGMLRVWPGIGKAPLKD